MPASVKNSSTELRKAVTALNNSKDLASVVKDLQEYYVVILPDGNDYHNHKTGRPSGSINE